ncbi:hypothetical protein [Neisseria sp. Ec49-e6-T10]|uniref:hypothetical protein n=1 Tax=Neisseria sp. Ec49-e6-T10 TaxID=3140744 RepID=UPI003EB83606
MKKILFIYFIILSNHAFSMRVMPKELDCKNYGWAELIISKHEINGTTLKYLVCISPDGNYYLPLDLWSNHYEYQLLLKQYSGQYPTFEQIEHAKEQIRQDGFILD